MASFDDRERGEEARFAHQSETAFRIEARRSKLVGLWAAGQFGLTGQAAEAYVAELVVADLAEAGTEDLLRKLAADFRARNVPMSDDVIRARIAECGEQARSELTA